MYYGQLQDEGDTQLGRWREWSNLPVYQNCKTPQWSGWSQDRRNNKLTKVKLYKVAILKRISWIFLNIKSTYILLTLTLLTMFTPSSIKLNRHLTIGKLALFFESRYFEAVAEIYFTQSPLPLYYLLATFPRTIDLRGSRSPNGFRGFVQNDVYGMYVESGSIVLRSGKCLGLGVGLKPSKQSRSV